MSRLGFKNNDDMRVKVVVKARLWVHAYVARAIALYCIVLLCCTYVVLYCIVVSRVNSVNSRWSNSSPECRQCDSDGTLPHALCHNRYVTY